MYSDWGPPPGGADLLRAARHFFFGPGRGPRGFGPESDFGPGRHMFGRGDMKYALLSLLEERPKHGYEMIKELEDRSHGMYAPSAGSIYPTLQLLEDRGWVTSEVADGRKVYTITEEGRAALAERGERAERMGPHHGPHGHGHHEHGQHGHEDGPKHGWRGFARWQENAELRTLAFEGRELAHLMRSAVMATGGDAERIAQVREIVRRCRGDLVAFLSATEAARREPPPPAASNTPAESAPGEAGPTEHV